MGLLGRLFGGKSKPAPHNPAFVRIADMNLAGLLAHLQSLESPVFGDLSQAYQQLINIGLFQHGYTDQDRDVALQVADALKADIIASCKDQPGAAEALEKASAFQIGQAQFYGFGSLHWIAEDAGVGAADLVEFSVQPEFADLLPNYLAMQSPETIGEIRYEFVKAMIAARREHEDQTDLQVLFELASKPDPALDMLMPEAELAIVRKAPSEYEAAELLANIYR